ncbi:KxYKxGKxW signal peptide domain-containing protein [Alloacidobacterium dinghuense]|uniref:KxYKxGKxW signal peptide domain-containing protein n=1 Tax=Alloacidobacterium dinghuense TaxID=2763107 RepID=A0A7G8BML7_9BACT|nr:KxYKxGKxW signal peptide domain-containing protein [Alloacidobacterium dinghuense]QNI33787.1 KxYKxGKxW signal peptide domain-containing protein [Alloacidobacterium dinghuense]
MRFRIYKSGTLWIFAAIDLLIGQIPLATSTNWLVLTVMADQVSVNYRLQSLSRC